MSARLRFISEAHQTVRDDIALTRRATEKTSTDVTKAEEDKLNQVTCMYIHTCTPMHTPYFRAIIRVHVHCTCTYVYFLQIHVHCTLGLSTAI